MSYIGSVNLNENVRDTTTGNVYSLETYLEDHWQLNDHWSVDAGVRFSLLAVPHAVIIPCNLVSLFRTG